MPHHQEEGHTGKHQEYAQTLEENDERSRTGRLKQGRRSGGAIAARASPRSRGSFIQLLEEGETKKIKSQSDEDVTRGGKRNPNHLFYSTKKLELEQFPQAPYLCAADGNFGGFLVVHFQHVAGFEPRHYFFDVMNVHEVGAVRAPEGFRIFLAPAPLVSGEHSSHQRSSAVVQIRLHAKNER